MLLGSGGAPCAWYGTPDARIRSTEGDTVVAWDSSEQEIESDGESVLVEGKFPFILRKHLGQVVATVMTHSFTEHHNHKTLNSMDPNDFIGRVSYHHPVIRLHSRCAPHF